MGANQDRGLMRWFAICWAVLILSGAGWWAWAYAASTYTDKFSLEMPEQGDVGWDDALRTNHKIFEVVVTPILEGHRVISGATVEDGGSGVSIAWSAGWVQISGASYYMLSGATDLTNNTLNWISAVTADAAASGVTVQVRSTEYDIPSGASGFAHVPLALAVTEAGDIVRLKDLRYMPANPANLQTTGMDWEIDGDKLDIDWTPSYYTPSTTPSEADNVDNLTAHLYGIDQALNGKASTGTAQTWTAIQTFDQAVGNIFRSGASPAMNVPDSGTSLEEKYFGTIVTHDQATSTIYGMPPISGVSVLYVKFIESATGGGITIYNVNAEPFLGDGLTGTSYFALPPGCPFESATIYSVQTSGTCKYWFVEASSSWTAGN